MISLNDLSFRYHDEQSWIIRNESHDFHPGTVTVLTGVSGSGKSTLLYLLALMLSPTGGGVLDSGDVVSRWPDFRRAQWRAERIGFVFQDAVLDQSRSIIDNVLEGSLFRPGPPPIKRAHDLLEKFGVQVDPLRKPGEISGGQAQRVALCRALINSPSLVLADEPTGNLDSDTADIVWDALEEAAAKGATVIVATHDRIRASKYQHQLIVENGRIG